MPVLRGPILRKKHTRRSTPSRPSPTARARAQERAYESQGRAVERAANRQRREGVSRPRSSPTRPAPAFRPPFRPAPQRGPGRVEAVTPIEERQREQRRKTRRAAGRLPRERLRRFPILREYTPRQQRIIVREQGGRLEQVQRGRSVRDTYMQAGGRERSQLRLLRFLQEGRASRIAERRGIPIGRDRVRAMDARDAQVAGFLPIEQLAEELDERLFPRAMPGLRLAKVPFELGRATVEDPVAVGKSSIRTAVESVAGIPAGVKAIVENPSEGLRAIAEDYEQRYGPILEGNTAEFRRRVQEDYGITPFALDAAAAGAGTGQIAGAVARSGAYGRAVTALRSVQRASPRGFGGGRVGSATVRALEEARTTATRDRPLLRRFAGEAGARAQQTSRNLGVAAGQRVLDRARRGRFERQARQAGFDVDGGQLRSREGAQVQRLPAFRPGEGEVIPLGGVREAPILRRLTGRVARDVGGAKSQARIRLLQRRAQTVKAIDDAIAKLTPQEQQALKYVRQLGLPAGRNLAASVRALEQRLDQIRATREARGFDEVKPALRDDADDAAAIERILADPETHLTSRVRDVADDLSRVTRTEEALDPDLTPGRGLIRRDRPQAALLGVERGPDVAFFEHVLEAIERKVADGEDLTPGTVTDVFGELAAILPEARTTRARQLEGELRRMAGAAGRRAQTVERRLQAMRAVVRERERRGIPRTTDELRQARGELAQATRDARQLRSERDRLMGEQRGASVEAERVRGVKYGPDFRRDDRAARLADVRATLAAAEQRVKDLRQAVRQAEAEAPRVSEALTARVARLERDVRLSREGRDAARQLHRIARIVTRASKSKKTMRLESAEAFDAKVRKAAEAAGLVEPDYWMSSPRPQQQPSLAAVGTGGRAAAKSKRYRGKLFDLGIEETGPDALRRGAERNIKRRFSWALTSRNMEVHAFEWSRGEQGEGLTGGELLREFDDRAIDPSTVALISPRIARRRSLDQEGVERGRILDDAADESLDDTALAEIHDDLAEATVRPRLLADGRSPELEDLVNAEVQGQAMNRYLVVPREVADELEAATRPDGALARSLQIVLNQKPARILLGTLNAPWLMFQVASNGLLTGLGGGRNPLDIYGAHKWWRGLSDAEKEAVEVELGITHGQAWQLDQARLGAASEKMGSARHLVNFWRAYKKSRVGRLAHKVNPLDLMFRADEAQNNFFRRVLFYSNAKRAAYRRMGKSWRGMDAAQGKLASVLGLPPERMGAAIAKHGPEFEQHAQRVRDFLGDYLRFSDQERKLLSRNVMFYGYLRFSLRFAFHTMPVQHPVMTAILGDIGRMGAQEIKELFGVPDNYRLPTSMVAQAYFGSREDARKGRLRSINFGRLNPALNAITQLESEQQAIGLVSPIYQSVADQFFEESSFTGREFRILGEYPPNESVRPKNYYGSVFGALIPGRPRNRILTRDLASLAFPYRLAEKTGVPEVRLPLLGKVPGTGVAPLEGPQGDDSLLWSPRPTRYKDEELQQSIRRSVRQQRERGPGEALVDQLVPVLRPQPTQAPRVIEREREKEASQRKSRRRGGRRRGSNAADRYGGAAAGNPYGGSSRRSRSDLSSRYGG